MIDNKVNIPSGPPAKDAEGRYGQLAYDRVQFLDRARHNALLTIPSLMPLEGHDHKAHLYEPYQGLGADAVNHLTSRLATALLPAGRPYLRLDLKPEDQLLLQGTPADQGNDIARQLALAEQAIQAEAEAKDWRPATNMSLQQNIVCGSVCEHQLENNIIRIIRLDQHVVTRSYYGRPQEALILDYLNSNDARLSGVEVPQDAKRQDGIVNVYTWIRLTKGGLVFEVHQEVANGVRIGPSIEYAVDDLPYSFLRWNATPGEDYGRSKVEDTIADLRSLDALEKANLEMAAMASRNFIMVRPGATSSGIKQRLTQAMNGDVVAGDPEGVELKSFTNLAGYQITENMTNRLIERLARSYLLHSAGQRNAERVTATEIERDVAELEAALGGNFSILNTDMMEPRTRRLMANMERDGRLPELTGKVQPVILTGLEALSRERDVSRVMQMAEIARAFGEEGQDVLKLGKLLGYAATGLSFADVIYTDQEALQRQQARQQQAIMEKGIGPAIQAASKQEGE